MNYSLTTFGSAKNVFAWSDLKEGVNIRERIE